MHPCVHCGIIYNRQAMKKPKCLSIDEWLKKSWYIYTMEYYSTINKKSILSFATAWTRPRGHYTK